MHYNAHANPNANVVIFFVYGLSANVQGQIKNRDPRHVRNLHPAARFHFGDDGPQRGRQLGKSEDSKHIQKAQHHFPKSIK